MKIFRVKPNREKTFKQWGRKLSTEYLSEAKEALREENCNREWFRMFEIDGVHYVAAEMEGENILPSTDRPLNKAHKQVLQDCLEFPAIETEVVYDIKQP